MSEFKGTPGPWLNDDHLVYALDETGGVNRFSCMMQPGFVYHGRTVKEPVKIDELTANARLIAAAPDLLKALEGAIGALEQDLDEGRDSGDADWEGIAYQRLEAAKAAIAKALQP